MWASACQVANCSLLSAGCRALGCLLPSCQLCKHNPSRRCAVNFDKKYLVNDVLKAKCQAVIRVEIVERTTNMPVELGSLRDEMMLQMAILDGNTYDAKFEAGLENDFESCLLLMNNKVLMLCKLMCLVFMPTSVTLLAAVLCKARAVHCGRTLLWVLRLRKVRSTFLQHMTCRSAYSTIHPLQSTPTLVGMAVSNDQHGFVRMPLTSSRAVLPDLRVTDSSEAMLSGRKPPLRLMMRAVYKDTLQPVPHIRHAISEGFVVAVCALTPCCPSSCADSVSVQHCSSKAKWLHQKQGFQKL